MERRNIGWALTAILMLGSAAGLDASAIYSGTVAGTWSDPVLTGSTIRADTGAPTFLDNTIDARCNLSPCLGPPADQPEPPPFLGYGADTVAWGILDASFMTFTGAAFDSIPSDTDFKVGTITYRNATSGTNRLIFAVTLRLVFTMTLGDQVDPLDISVPITTTSNFGTAEQNADFVGPFDTPAQLTFNVYEDATATADLYGRIVGDPQLSPQYLLSTSPGGFIGTGLPAPEPGTLGLMGAALLGMAARRRLG